MAFLKKHWFPLVNGVVFLACVVVYVLMVAALDADEAKLQSEIEGGIRSHKALAQKRPTEAFQEILRQSREALDQQAGQVKKAFKESDQLMESYFALGGDGVTAEAPDPQRLPEYKQKTKERWDRMEERYTPGAGVAASTTASYPFACERSVLALQEPRWLRVLSQPGLDEVKDAQKRFWLTDNLLGILAEAGVVRLGALTIGDARAEPSAEYAGRPVWSARDIIIEVHLSHARVKPLLRRIHESQLLLRTVGLEQRNDTDGPRGVRSDAPFIAFSEDATVTLKLWVRHYDLLSEEDVRAMKDSASAGGRR